MVAVAGVWMLPVLIWYGPPPAATWPWAIAGLTANFIAIHALGAAYRTSDFSTAYPIARGVAPVGVLLLAGLAVGEWPAPVAIGGVILVSVALLTLVGLARASLRPTGTLFALVSGIGVACAVFADSRGVAATGDPLHFGALMSVINAIMFGGLSLMRGGAVPALARARPAFLLGWTAISNASYMLFLVALSLGPAAMASALRETSILFATFIAARVFGETIRPLHWAAVGLALVGAALMRLG